jgi:hypothetical protein
MNSQKPDPEPGPARERTPSAGLARLLAAEDLDDLVKLASALPEVSADDAAVVRKLIQDWRPQQAVANLLIHARLLPPDIRVATILKALVQRDRPYLILASVVGLQSIKHADVMSADAALIADQLLQLIGSDQSIISSRASVSIENWLDGAHAPAVSKLLNHPNDTVGHNLLAWLIRHVEAADLGSLLEASGLTPEKLGSAIADVDEYAKCRDAGVSFTRASVSFFGYIPNLSECRDDAASN